MNEIWKDIKNYEGLYQASNWGRLRTLNYRQQKGVIKIMSLQKMRGGHYQVTLSKNGHSKKYLVHVLIFETFYRRLQANEVVHHLSEVKTQNNIENLVAWDKVYHKRFHMLGNKLCLGHMHSQQTKNKIRRALKGRIPWNKGKVMKKNEAKEATEL